jgi:beta-galactosidase
MKKTFFLMTMICLAAIFNSQAQPLKFTNPLYGVAYYHEYMPTDRLAEDVRMMKDAGISVVRLGESTWSLFEPQEGEFEFDWMDRILDALHKAGIKVILGTPTYSMPAWLWHKHPEVLVKYERGQQAYYGIRQNMDITNPTFLFYAERIIRKMMAQYAKHPAIIGYQVDNETTSYGVNNYDFQISFVDYLKKKFGTTEALNQLWGLNYWGMTMNDWDEFPPRDGITNTGYKLEWERFKRKTVADYLSWQASIVNEYKRKDQFITHCFMPSVQDIDQLASSRFMDIMSVNIYHGSQDKLTGDEIAFAGDFFRSVKRTNYLVTETNAQTIGWDSRSQYPPYDGQLRMNVYAHLGSGANMVEYWHWHSIHYGQETYWKGVLSHDLQPNRAYIEVSKTAHELQKFGKKLVNLKIKNKVAILFSHDSNAGLNIMPFKNAKADMWGSASNVYRNELVGQFHRVLYRNNIGVDFVFPDDPHLSDYSLVIIPSLYIASDKLLQQISEYVKNGGQVVMQFKSGFCDENSMVRPVMAPGPLRAACGFYYQEFTNFGELSLKDNPFGVADAENKVYDWAEYLIPETAKPVAFYDHPQFRKYPAITINTYGKGTLLYEATSVSDAIQEKILLQALDRAGLTTPDQQLHWPLITKSGTNDSGKKIHYYYNYSSQEATFDYPHKAGMELTTNKSVETGQKLDIKPWDVLIIEEK